MFSILRKDFSEHMYTISVLGIDSEGNVGLRLLIYCIVLLFLTFNSLFVIVYSWDKMETRIDSIRAGILYLLCLCYLQMFIFKWPDVMMLLTILQGGHYGFPFGASQKWLNLKESIRNDMIKLNSIWFMLLDFLPIFMALPHIILLAYRMTKPNFLKIPIDQLTLLLPFYFPPGFKILPVYFLTQVLQIYVLYFASCTAKIVIVTPFVLMQQVEGDLKLLRLHVQELESMTTVNKKANKNHESETFQYESKTKVNNVMISFFPYFIQHQYYIYRKVNKVIKGMQYIAFVIDTALYLLMCMMIYRSVQSNDIMIQLQEVLISCILLYGLYCYNIMGEKITLADENVRQELYNTPWTDKSICFRKSLHVVLTKMIRPLEIKRIGIFSLNLRNFVAIVRAAYSLYNVLNSFTD